MAERHSAPSLNMSNVYVFPVCFWSTYGVRERLYVTVVMNAIIQVPRMFGYRAVVICSSLAVWNGKESYLNSFRLLMTLFRSGCRWGETEVCRTGEREGMTVTGYVVCGNLGYDTVDHSSSRCRRYRRCNVDSLLSTCMSSYCQFGSLERIVVSLRRRVDVRMLEMTGSVRIRTCPIHL